MNGIDLQALDGRPVIVGAGLAGLITALHLAPEPVVVVSKAPLGLEASSSWAQGGLAAAIGPDDDPELHLADTLAAGDGLCDAEIAGRIVRAASQAIEELERLGVCFERSSNTGPLLGLEAAHSRRRIVHANGDATGREIMRALVAAVHRTSSITVLEGFEARQVLIDDGAVSGLIATGPSGPIHLTTSRVVIATGSIGGLYEHTTTPLGSFGQGLLLAARAGAELQNLEFVQFHPTALDGSSRPMSLVSEAVRGEGAFLIDETGRRFLEGTPGAELAARDVVARAVARHLADGHRVFLDARVALGSRFAQRFPSIDASCKAANIDPSREPIPIRPAVHYHMGGIAVNSAGRSSVSGLWACGEVATTGLHGANRLASNSLIEAAITGRWVAESIAGTVDRARLRPLSVSTSRAVDVSPVRSIVSRALGVVRDGNTMREAIAALLPLAESNGPASDPACIAMMMAVPALARKESRGAHFRTDFPARNEHAVHSSITLDQAFDAARNLVSEPILPLVRSA